MKVLKNITKILAYILSVVGICYLFRISTFYFIKPDINLLNPPDKYWKPQIENNRLKLEYAFSINWDSETIIDEIYVYFPIYISPEIHSIYKIEPLYDDSIKLRNDRAEILFSSLPFNIFKGKSPTYYGYNPAVLFINPFSRRKQPGNAYHTFWLKSRIGKKVDNFEIIILFVVRKDPLEMGFKRFFFDQGPWMIKLKKTIKLEI